MSVQVVCFMPLDLDNAKAFGLNDAGCRLPLADPALDDYDQDLVDAAEVGDRLYPDDEGDNNGFPGTPILASPTHQATGISTNVTLTWAASDETNDYEVFLDTNIFPTTSIGVTSNTQLQASNLQANTLYRWRVVARDGCENTSGTLAREFTTE